MAWNWLLKFFIRNYDAKYFSLHLEMFFHVKVNKVLKHDEGEKGCFFFTLFPFIPSLSLQEVKPGGFIEKKLSRTLTSCKKKSKKIN